MSHDDHLPLPELVSRLCAAIGQVDPAGGGWLSKQLVTQTLTSTVTAFAWVHRKLGGIPLTVDLGGFPAPEAGWDSAHAARSALLIQFAARHPPDELQRLVTDLFYRGDTLERCAVLRSLKLLPEPPRYALIATDGVRSHVQPVFEAIACENPYPAAHLDELAFNQLVMKAYFTGVRAARIHGLRARLNPELRRMALDYEAERTAAGRPVPADLSLITRP